MAKKIKDDTFGTLEFSSKTKKWLSREFRESENILVGFVAEDQDTLRDIVESSKSLGKNREKLFERVQKRVVKEEFKDVSELWEDEHETKLTKKKFVEMLPSPRFITFSESEEEFFELSVECEELFDDGYVVISGTKSGKILEYVFY